MGWLSQAGMRYRAPFFVLFICFLPLMVLMRRKWDWRKSVQLERVWLPIGQCHGRRFKTSFGFDTWYIFKIFDLYEPIQFLPRCPSRAVCPGMVYRPERPMKPFYRRFLMICQTAATSPTAKINSMSTTTAVCQCGFSSIQTFPSQLLSAVSWLEPVVNPPLWNGKQCRPVHAPGLSTTIPAWFCVVSPDFFD